MARIMYQDRAYIVPEDSVEGSDLLTQLQVPPDHDLVLVRPEGNVLVSRRHKVQLADGDQFVDAPVFEYGLMSAQR